MKIRKTIALIISSMLIASLCLMSACSSDTVSGETDAQDEVIEETEVPSSIDDGSADTESISGDLMYSFSNTDTNGDHNALAEELSQVSSNHGYDCMVVSVSEGYLNGFDVDVSGFNEGYMISPVIGSIPFVVYVFESDDAIGLSSFLYENANPAWNICTMADDTFTTVSGNYVLFGMVPNS